MGLSPTGKSAALPRRTLETVIQIFRPVEDRPSEIEGTRIETGPFLAVSLEEEAIFFQSGLVRIRLHQEEVLNYPLRHTDFPFQGSGL